MTVKQYDIVLNYDTSKADASLASFRAGVIRAFQELQSRTAKIEVLKDLQKDAVDANAAVVKLKDRSDELAKVLGKLGRGDVGFKQLAAEVKVAERDLKAAEKAAGAIADKIRLLDGELRAAGVDTKNLAVEQAALAKALEASQRAIAAQAARQTLGVVSTDEARAQIAKLREAYDVLRASGTASINELQLAKARLNQKIQEVEASMSGLSGTTGSFNLRMLALAASTGVVATSLTAAAKAAIDYEQGIARISSITDLNTRQLDEMGRAVLALTQKIGIDLPTALKATYEIISSGIPAGNALDVLESSARAAIAGVTDVSTAARIGVATLNAYGLQVGQLDRVYDILFQTVKDGVITFPELSEKLGLVLPAAKNAGLSLEDVSAAVVVLTRAGFNAPRAMVALEGAIKQLAAPTDEAAAAMLQLDIRYNGFIGTVEQIAKKNLGPETLRRLIPDVEGQRAIATLAQNFGLLKRQVDEVTQSSGAAKEAFDKLANTPEQEIKKFSAAVDALKVAIGEQLTRALGVVLPSITAFVTSLADGERKVGAMSAALGLFAPTLVQSARAAQDAAAFADVLGPALARAGVEAGKAKLPVGGLSDRYLVLKAATEAAVSAAVSSANALGGALGPAIAKVEQQLALLDARIVANTSNLEQLQKRLEVTAGGLQGVLNSQLTEIGANLERSVAVVEIALAKREVTEAESIKRIAKLNTDAEASRVAAIKTFAESAIKAFEAESAARLALVRKSGGDVVAAEIDINGKRIALLSELQSKYGAVATEAINQQKRAADAIKAGEEDLRKVREAGALQQREIAVANGTEVQKYYQRQTEAERLLSEAQKAGAQGRIDLQREYADRALAIAKTLDQGVSDSEGRFISAERAKANASTLTSAALKQQEQAITAGIDAQKAAAKAAEDTKTEAVGAVDQVAAKVADARAKQLDVIALRVSADAKQVGDEIARLDALLQERALVKEVKLSTDAAKLDIQDLVDAIEKKKPQVEIQAKLDKLRADVEAAEAGLPKLGIETDTTAVDNAFAAIGNSIETLGKKKFELQNNLDEISAKLNELNGKQTRSVHTIELRYEDTRGNPAAAPAGAVPAPAKFASGGLVSFDGIKAMASARRFASGGFVGKVPGIGDQDSVFRMLASGSFVLRKLASRALLENRALPGRSLGDSIFASGVDGAAGSGSFDGSLDSFIRSLNAAEVFNRGAQIAALFDAAQRAQDKSIAELRAKFPTGYIEAGAEALTHERNRPRFAAILGAYDSARASRNESKANEATSAAIDYAKTISVPARALTLDEAQAKAAREQAGLNGGGTYLADGGSVTGGAMIPAMLTPGELVFSPDAVKQIGLQRLQALNAMRFAEGGFVPPGIAAMVDNLARFNAGGAVTNNNASTNNTNNYGGVSVTINAGGTTDARQLARGLVDELNNIARRRK